MTFFDKFADKASRLVASAPFFTFCLLLVVIWLPSLVIIKDTDTWQLIINTTTTIITFLMVAILENSTQQFENGMNAKLDKVLKLLGEVEETDTAEAEAAIGMEKNIGT